MDSDVKLYLTPWLPSATLIIVFVISVFISPDLASKILKFSSSIPFHIFAIIPFVLTFYFIFFENEWVRLLPAIINFTMSFMVWVGLIKLITADWNLI
jgi:hypothetical protein